MRRRIPSTGALVAFEAAARNESFTKAAEDLALTQSAVCRQIASLENFLGVALFRRSRRGVKLTEAGTAYSRQVASRLDAVEQDTLNIMTTQGKAASIELAVMPTFATAWLLPRLSRFMQTQPGVTVNLHNRTNHFFFGDTELDAAIYFGDGSWPGADTHYLMDENAVAVCSPRLLQTVSKNGAPASPEAIASLPRLQHSTRAYAWRYWFESAGVTVANDLAGPRYELFSMLTQAARHDMGVALIPSLMIEEELASGQLVHACLHNYQGSNAYYFVLPERKADNTALREFAAWLQEQAFEYRLKSGAR